MEVCNVWLKTYSGHIDNFSVITMLECNHSTQKTLAKTNKLNELFRFICEINSLSLEYKEWHIN